MKEEKKIMDHLLASIAIQKAMRAGKFWRFRSWQSKAVWLLKVGLYQDPTRVCFGVGFDFSERPLVFMINLFFWAIEINIFTHKNQIY